MTKFRVGIVGYGIIAEEHANAWEDIPETELIGIADLAESRRQAAQEQHDCEVFGSDEEMFSSIKLDIVTVATQTPAHLRSVLLAFDHDCHVICEKSLALSPEDAGKMVNTAAGRS